MKTALIDIQSRGILDKPIQEASAEISQLIKAIEEEFEEVFLGLP